MVRLGRAGRLPRRIARLGECWWMLLPARFLRATPLTGLVVARFERTCSLALLRLGKVVKRLRRACVIGTRPGGRVSLERPGNGECLGRDSCEEGDCAWSNAKKAHT